MKYNKMSDIYNTHHQGYELSVIFGHFPFDFDNISFDRKI